MHTISISCFCRSLQVYIYRLIIDRQKCTLRNSIINALKWGDSINGLRRRPLGSWELVLPSPLLLCTSVVPEMLYDVWEGVMNKQGTSPIIKDRADQGLDGKTGGKGCDVIPQKPSKDGSLYRYRQSYQRITTDGCFFVFFFLFHSVNETNDNVIKPASYFSGVVSKQMIGW